MRVIFYSALACAPVTRAQKVTTDSESLDDTDRVLEDLKRNQSTHIDDNFEITNSANQLNRFDALQPEDESEEKTKAEININNEEASSDDEDNEEKEDEDGESDDDDNADEAFVEPIRDDVLAYGQSKDSKKKNLSSVVNREELIYLLKSLYTHKSTTREDILTIGMVSERRFVLSIKDDLSLHRSAIPMWAKVQPSTPYYSTRKYQYRQHRAKPNIFR